MVRYDPWLQIFGDYSGSFLDAGRDADVLPLKKPPVVREIRRLTTSSPQSQTFPSSVARHGRGHRSSNGRHRRAKDPRVRDAAGFRGPGGSLPWNAAGIDPARGTHSGPWCNQEKWLCRKGRASPVPPSSLRWRSPRLNENVVDLPKPGYTTGSYWNVNLTRKAWVHIKQKRLTFERNGDGRMGL